MYLLALRDEMRLCGFVICGLKGEEVFRNRVGKEEAEMEAVVMFRSRGSAAI